MVQTIYLPEIYLKLIVKKDFREEALFLQEVCKQVSIPVYGIGGITPDCMGTVLGRGFRGCMMSGFLKLQGERKHRSSGRRII